MKNNTKKIPCILNVDTGIDDSLALAIAFMDEKLDVKLVATSKGNTSIENTTYNTLCLMQWFKKGNIPVAQGNGIKQMDNDIGEKVHGGPTGMGAYVFPELKLKKSELSAVDAMWQLLKESDEKLTIICVSPATNIGDLLHSHPEISSKIERFVFQSGLLSDENYQSFNVTMDPDAFQIIMDAGIPILINPSDLGHISCLNDEEVAHIASLNETGKMYATNFKDYHEEDCGGNVATHDSCAVACVTRPDLFKIERAKCSLIERDNKTYFRFEVNAPDSNCDCCTEMDIQGFKNYVYEIIKKCDNL